MVTDLRTGRLDNTTKSVFFLPVFRNKPSAFCRLCSAEWADYWLRFPEASEGHPSTPRGPWEAAEGTEMIATLSWSRKALACGESNLTLLCQAALSEQKMEHTMISSTPTLYCVLFFLYMGVFPEHITCSAVGLLVGQLEIKWSFCFFVFFNKRAADVNNHRHNN